MCEQLIYSFISREKYKCHKHMTAIRADYRKLREFEKIPVMD